MKIFIIENEIYLAQSIATKLGDLGHTCEIATTIGGALEQKAYDVVLLSTNISGQDFTQIINVFKNAIIILMVSYVSNDTVSKPLSMGAKDYIVKPFMISELVRKIDHYQDYERLKRKALSYERYLQYQFSQISLEQDVENIQLPVFISSSFQKYADAFAFKYATHIDQALYFLSLADPKAFSEIANLPSNALIYATDFQSIKKTDRKDFLELIKEKQIIVSSTDKIHDIGFLVVDIKSENHIFEKSEILQIEEYVKYVVINYQSKFPDTELSKKLGISRKSLWEKRKKYGITKKK
jgi:DNA-binding NtrC family response regulator